ncbi:MAG TPA: SUMF1/EgtB/PvdO family nonheme iron enzyme [Leptospiraceae bacterium]|nr:SUMF1/EgtB/PvdO family nonheme iron enzyme [Leptospiraceae bacterium]HMW08695.1 SUMF1/EgtB/PvdO family nonheme iron enzyme [Leptospiraceae bacterium]HMY34401.1 SUMF1/EgtB/PvdO family nonheme iron enzyme [Leptospiraceae bacterium]HMZ67120.1 SUMF1/EgtB/PvdO family nonheme iron enzyme [Leptospiraceae bacterium]HNA10299.1 SUMF1/EgtB/PvdO family nonheme iron enzyme [Leptospiraceae bacterium]
MFIWNVIFLLSSTLLFSQDLPKLEFVKIRGGDFSFDYTYFYQFHSAKSPNPEKKITVRISPFSITKYPITRQYWEKYMGNDFFTPWEKDKLPDCPECPAYGIFYQDAMLFIKKISLKETGREDSYRLPTESEMIYLVTSSEPKYEKILGFGTSMDVSFGKAGYKNLFNLPVNDEIMSGYVWTNDFASNNYLEEFLNAENLTLPIKDPNPKPISSFSYGKILFRFTYDKNENKMNLYRLSFTTSRMLPESEKVFLRFVKKEK